MDEGKAKDMGREPHGISSVHGERTLHGMRSPELGKGGASSESGKEGTGAGSREGWPGSNRAPTMGSPFRLVVAAGSYLQGCKLAASAVGTGS